MCRSANPTSVVAQFGSVSPRLLRDRFWYRPLPDIFSGEPKSSSFSARKMSKSSRKPLSTLEISIGRQKCTLENRRVSEAEPFNPENRPRKPRGSILGLNEKRTRFFHSQCAPGHPGAICLGGLRDGSGTDPDPRIKLPKTTAIAASQLRQRRLPAERIIF